MNLGTNICDSKTNSLSTIPHKFILCSFSKGIGNLTGLMEGVLIMRHKANRDKRE